MHRKKALSIFMGWACCLGSLAGGVPEHVSNRPLYDFLDELATEHVIELKSVVKPYHRSLIAEKLLEADSKKELLNSRQQALLEMYLRDFALEAALLPGEGRKAPDPSNNTFLSYASVSLLPPVLRYDDGLFRLQLKPVYGIRYYANGNGNVCHTWGGAEALAYVGSRWTIWASLRDNYMTNEILAEPHHLTPLPGGAWKRGVQGRSGGDYSEMRAGIAYSWQWGTMAFQKEHLEWGDNNNGANILSGRTPSYPMIKLDLNPAPWFSFTYHHGWLQSMVTDSLRAVRFYEGHPLRRVHHNKFFAANMFTITPLPRLEISAGNSVMYSEEQPYPGYLIPFMFFKSVVHTQAQNQGVNHNSAMFVNISSRQIKHLHLYGSWFIDEFSIVRIGDPERLNFTSTKAGFRLSNWPVNNIAVTGEYTFTFPKTFQHRTPTTTYTSNYYNLGHYLQDNARELYVAVQAQPFRGLWVEASYLKAAKGNVRPYLYGIGPQDRDPFMQETVWENNTIALKSRYLLYNNISIFVELHRMNIQGFDAGEQPAQYYLDRFSPKLFHGKTLTWSAGIHMGF